MKRDTFIIAIAIAQAAYFVLSGLWPLADIQSFEVVTGNRAEHGALRSLAGVQIVIGAALIWSVYRGLVDPPLRVVVTGASAVLGIAGIISALAGPSTAFLLIDGGIHLAFAVCWAGILMTSGSPYRPRPVIQAKRMRQSTGEDPGRWK